MRNHQYQDAGAPQLSDAFKAKEVGHIPDTAQPSPPAVRNRL